MEFLEDLEAFLIAFFKGLNLKCKQYEKWYQRLASFPFINWLYSNSRLILIFIFFDFIILAIYVDDTFFIINDPQVLLYKTQQTLSPNFE